MKYSLIGENNKDNIIKQILNNRGIDDWKGYLELNEAPRDTYKNLNNIDKAVELFDKHFQQRNKMLILQDCDCDGITSSTIMYKYIKDLDTDYPVDIAVHTNNKSHGLDSYDFTIDDDVKLLFTPDAASNDVQQHVELHERGIDCLCLDHHAISTYIDDSPAVIVNNQDSDAYANKDCCGASITLEFCRALDEHFWEDYADKYLDLACVGNVADVMSLKSFETRAIVNEGVTKINNKMLKEIIKAQDFSMKGIVSPFTIAFYVAPLINAFIRSATFEERQLLVRAFCEDESKTFEYIKRGELFPTEENIYEHVVRLMKSYKGKQDRARDKAFKELMKQAENYKNDKVAIIDASKDLDSAYTGLVAIKLSEALNQPVLLVRKTKDSYVGSGRAFNYCPIEDFRELVEKCPVSTLAQGHSSAFGVALSDIDQAREWFNEKLKDVSFEKVYAVDFVTNAQDLQPSWCQELYEHQAVFAHGVDEPLWYIHNLHISNDNAKIIGKNLDTVQIYDEDTGIKYVMFKCDESNPVFNWLNDNWDDTETNINIIGTLGLNEYQGVYTPQVMIKDCEVIE